MTDAAPAIASAAETIDRHLVIVWQPHWQSIDDWRAIAARLRRLDPRIGVFVASSVSASPELATEAATRPSVVVSPGPLGLFEPQRGKRLVGRQVSKANQLRLLNAAGLPVPNTTMLTPTTQLDPARWGELVVLKPTDLNSSSRGIGIQLMRTSRVRYRAREDYPEDHPGRAGPMLVQQFIDTGPFITSYRVLMFLGEPLYIQRMQSTAPRVDLDAADSELEGAPIAMQAHREQIQSFVYEADVAALARAAHTVLPDVPLLGVDILRDTRNGRLYVMELNPGGNTWHFSSALLSAERERNGAAFEAQRREQLDAFGTAAQLLRALVRRDAE